MVAAADDDQILEATRDEQFVVVDEAQVAGPHERAVARVFEVGVERVFGFGGTFPIAFGHARAGDPDFADVSRRALDARFRLGNHDTLIEQTRTGADERPRIRIGLAGVDDDALFERLAVEVADDRRIKLEAAGNDERRFGQAVARVERFAAETTRGESFREALDRAGAHRLRAVEGDQPT